MLPALVGQLVVVLKDSALGYVITYEELLKQGQPGRHPPTRTSCPPSWSWPVLFPIVINYGLTRLAVLLERRLSRRGRTSGRAPAEPGALPVDLMGANTETG